jgi:4'-phosphopantetheinyl transferase
LASERTVSVWRVALEPGRQALESLRRHLSSEELQRVERLRGSEVGRRWLVSRGALREILAAELETAPTSVRLRLGPYGRPGLDPLAHSDDLDFNLSHSGELALVAIGRGLRVGVDVERLRAGRNALRVADRYFSRAEVEAVRAVPEREQPAEFLRYWTAKEALAKGLGVGLHAPIGGLELAPRPGGGMVPVREATDWRLLDLEVPSGYFATLAIDDEDAQVVIREWQPGATSGPSS